MKVTTRSTPCDILSVEENGRKIRLMTHGNYLMVSVDPGQPNPEESIVVTFTALFNCLQAFVDGLPLPPPSEADKEATAGAGEANSGTQEGGGL